MRIVLGCLIGGIVGFTAPFMVGTIVQSIGALAYVGPERWGTDGREMAAVIGLMFGAIGVLSGAGIANSMPRTK